MCSQNEFFYISLGSDCSVSYQLRQLNLQTFGSLPFDWIKINNFDDIINIFQNDFQDFLNLDYYKSIPQSNNFNYFDDSPISNNISTNVSENITSNYKLVHTKYKIVLPHEFIGDNWNKEEFIEKYSRRVERLKCIMKDASKMKIFVRLMNKPYSKEIEKKSKLEKILKIINCKNYKILMINPDECQYLIPAGEFCWKRDYMPWHKILLMDKEIN